jgi:sugar-specific transcriptional regulator TrmB
LKSNIFTQAGLNKNEAAVYELVLDKGEITPPEIAEKLNLGRTNVYAILNNLADLELIEEIGRKKKMTFRPLPPSNLLALAEKNKIAAEESEKMIRSIVPQLMSTYNLSSGKPGIVFYEGLEGVKKLYEERLKEKPEEVLVLRSIYDNEKLGTYLQGYVKRTALAGIKTRIISPREITKEVEENDKTYLRERKYIPEKIFCSDTQIDIYNDRVVFINLHNKLMGFIVNSKDVANSMKTIFELLWRAKF